jgi:predicted AlkP superfamily pyrophosphatase or phosphodiesterase
VVGIVIDQFRYDYLTRFRADYKGGLDRMMRQGAVFTNARYAQSPTVTAVGHSIFLTGAMPAMSGIVANAWYDRETGKQVTSVCDYSRKTVGAETAVPGARCEDWDPASPGRLLVSTVGDELRNRDERSKVFGISLKARSAILPSGHRANGAFWFDDKSGAFISSDFYFPELPKWVKDFNAQKLANAYVDQKWQGFDSWNFHAAAGSKRTYEKLPASPWGNELIEKLAERAIVAEKLGQGDATDLLTVSFSSNDYVGHQVGPDAPEVRDMALRVDALIGKLFEVVSQRVGMENAVFVLSADHGVAPTVDVQEQRRMPGGTIDANVDKIVRSALIKKFGDGDLVLSFVDNSFYLDYKAIEQRKLDVSAIYRTAADALMADPKAHVARVFNRDQLSQGIAGDFVSSAVFNGFNQERSGDIFVIFEPYRVPTRKGAAHSSPYNYDTHVPVIFFGAGVKPGWRHENIQVNDIAPTLATLMDVELPTGASGRVLTQILADQ